MNINYTKLYNSKILLRISEGLFKMISQMIKCTDLTNYQNSVETKRPLMYKPQVND